MEKSWLLKSQLGGRSAGHLLCWENARGMKVYIVKTNIFDLFETSTRMILNNIVGSNFQHLFLYDFEVLVFMWIYFDTWILWPL